MEFKVFDRTANTVESTAANAHTDDANFSIHAPLDRPGDRRRRHRATSPYRSVSDRELSLMQVCNDFICACVALPLALILFSYISPLAVNGRATWSTTCTVDSFFPVAVVIALAIGGVYRATSRRLQPSAFLEMRELGFGVGCGCVLTLAIGRAPPRVLRRGRALPHPGRGGGRRRRRRHHHRAHVPALLPPRADDHAGARGRRRRGGGPDHAEREPGPRHDVGRPGRRQRHPPRRRSRTVGGPAADLLPSWRSIGSWSPRAASSPPEVLDIYRALSETVHIAMVPRYFELISWRSKLSDLSGMPFLEIAQPHLSAWDQLMKRIFDIFVSGLILLITSPLLLVGGHRGQAELSRPRVLPPGAARSTRTALHGEQVPLHDGRARRRAREGQGAGGGCARRQRQRPTGTLLAVNGHLNRHGNGNGPTNGHALVDGGELELAPPSSGHRWPPARAAGQGGPDQPHHPLRRHPAQDRHRRDPPVRQRLQGGHVGRWTTPIHPEESQVEGWATRRFEVRPGITGLWQVSGRNDLSRNDLIQLDYLYVSSWSLWWDLKIMFETPQTMLRGTGAY